MLMDTRIYTIVMEDVIQGGKHMYFDLYISELLQRIDVETIQGEEGSGEMQKEQDLIHTMNEGYM